MKTEFSHRRELARAHFDKSYSNFASDIKGSVESLDGFEIVLHR